MSYVFVKRPQKKQIGERRDVETIRVKLDVWDMDADTLLEAFERFLRACGFGPAIEGQHLEWVSDEHPEERPDDPG